MNRHDFSHNARVTGSDGVPAGVLSSIEEHDDDPVLVVVTNATQQRRRIPLSQVDADRSTADEIIVLATAEAIEQGAGYGDEDRTTIPVFEEQLDTRIREAEQGRVIIEKRVETVPISKSIETTYDEVDVERIEKGEEMDEPPGVRQEGDTMIVPVLEEVLIVEKRYRLIEEVHITKRQGSRETRVEDDLRREVVDVRPEGDIVDKD